MNREEAERVMQLKMILQTNYKLTQPEIQAIQYEIARLEATSLANYQNSLQRAF